MNIGAFQSGTAQRAHCEGSANVRRARKVPFYPTSNQPKHRKWVSGTAAFALTKRIRQNRHHVRAV